MLSFSNTYSNMKGNINIYLLFLPVSLDFSGFDFASYCCYNCVASLLSPFQQ